MNLRPDIIGDPAPAASTPAASFDARLGALYSSAQTNAHVFASPMGPFRHGSHARWLQRFVFFGPHASDDSWRLALLAGLSFRDVRAALALLELANVLAQDAASGHGLNLTFFPFVDVAGAERASAAGEWAKIDWREAGRPELRLMTDDIREHGYHGFIRVETADAGIDTPTLSLRTREGTSARGPEIEFVGARDFDADVRFERIKLGVGPSNGPLDLVAGGTVRPFELILRVPGALPDDDYLRVAVHILTRVLVRYRAFQAFGGHL